MLKDFLWCEKYRPKTINDTVLPDHLKKTFQQFIDQRNVPNLMLSGSAGVGKTTVARAMLEELECDYIIINGSLNGNIDTLRNEIMNFASAISLSGGRKYVILDESDYLNPNSTQPALRNFMEEFSKNCGFILTCNFKEKIIAPLHSRCSVIDFKIDKQEKAQLAALFMKRACSILDTENVPYEKSVVAEVLKKYMPDWRRVLNELQRYSAVGKIDSGILSVVQETSLNQVVSYMKNKDFTSVRKWVLENDSDANEVYRNFFEKAETYFAKSSIPEVVLTLAKYQYQHAFAANPSINLASCLVELMVQVEFL
jgi:DNA polymerase III delta prime subunit